MKFKRVFAVLLVICLMSSQLPMRTLAEEYVEETAAEEVQPTETTADTDVSQPEEQEPSAQPETPAQQEPEADTPAGIDPEAQENREPEQVVTPYAAPQGSTNVVCLFAKVEGNVPGLHVNGSGWVNVGTVELPDTYSETDQTGAYYLPTVADVEAAIRNGRFTPVNGMERYIGYIRFHSVLWASGADGLAYGRTIHMDGTLNAADLPSTVTIQYVDGNGKSIADSMVLSSSDLNGAALDLTAAGSYVKEITGYSFRSASVNGQAVTAYTPDGSSAVIVCTYAKRNAASRVYVFTKVTGDTTGLVLNPRGWYTLGYLDLDRTVYEPELPTAEEVYAAIAAGSFTPVHNTGINVHDLTITNILWETNAEDLANGRTVHVDCTLDLREYASYSVRYVDKTTGAEIPGTGLTGQLCRVGDTLRCTDFVKTIDGYQLDSAGSSSITAVKGENTITIYYTRDTGRTKEVSYSVKYTVEGVPADSGAHDFTVTETGVWIHDPDTITIAEGGIPVPEKTGYRLDAENEALPAGGTEVPSGSVFTVNYVKDETQTVPTSYTVRYLLDGEAAETVTVTGTAWVLDEAPVIAIAEGGIPAPEKTGYKLDAENVALPAEGTEVPSGSVFTVNYVKDETQTVPTSYTVRYLLDGEAAETVTVTGTAWVLDEDPTIAIAEGGIPAAADKFPGYALSEANPRYPAEGTAVPSGTEFTVAYVSVPAEPPVDDTPAEEPPIDEIPEKTPATPVQPELPAVEPVAPVEVPPANDLAAESAARPTENDTAEEVEIIAEEETPLAGAETGKSWALLNLILGLLIGVMAVSLFLGCMAGEERNATRKRISAVLLTVLILAAALWVVLSMDLRTKMVLADSRTVLMVILTVAQAALSLRAKKTGSQEA